VKLVKVVAIVKVVGTIADIVGRSLGVILGAVGYCWAFFSAVGCCWGQLGAVGAVASG